MNGLHDPSDPKGLIRESYRIEGISDGECRSILLDWALSLPDGTDPRGALRNLLVQYGAEGHPMTALLHEGLGQVGRGRRRGG